MKSRITIDIISDKELCDEDVIGLYQYIKNGCAILSVVSDKSPLIGARLVFSAHHVVEYDNAPSTLKEIKL